MKDRINLIGLLIILVCAFSTGFLVGKINATGSTEDEDGIVEQRINLMQKEIAKLKLEPQVVKLPEFYKADEEPGIGGEFSLRVDERHDYSSSDL